MCKKILLFVIGVVMLAGFIPTSIMAAGTITNTANLVYKDPSGGTYTAQESCDLIVKLAPNIIITKKGWNVTQNGTTTYTDPVTGISGNIIEYQVTLTNNGEEIAKFVVMTDTLPGSVTFQSDAYGTEKGIKVDGVAQTNTKDADKANYNNGKIIVGKNEAGDNGNAVEITIDNGKSVTILYRVKID